MYPRLRMSYYSDSHARISLAKEALRYIGYCCTCLASKVILDKTFVIHEFPRQGLMRAGALTMAHAYIHHWLSTPCTEGHAELSQPP